jgi:hypothetical protein
LVTPLKTEQVRVLGTRSPGLSERIGE